MDKSRQSCADSTSTSSTCACALAKTHHDTNLTSSQLKDKDCGIRTARPVTCKAVQPVSTGQISPLVLGTVATCAYALLAWSDLARVPSQLAYCNVLLNCVFSLGPATAAASQTCISQSKREHRDPRSIRYGWRGYSRALQHTELTHLLSNSTYLYWAVWCRARPSGNCFLPALGCKGAQSNDLQRRFP